MCPAGSGRPALRNTGLYLLALLSTAVFAVTTACVAPPTSPLPEGVSVVPRGHREVEIQPDGSLLPIFFRGASSIGFCLETPPSLDSSQWEGQVLLDDHPVVDAYAPPKVLMRSTLCFFEPLPSDLEGATLRQLGGIVRDTFDGSEFIVPKRPVRIPKSSEAFQILEKELESVVATLDLPQDLLPALDGLTRRAEEEGFPGMAVRANLIAFHHLLQAGTPQALAEGKRRLDEMPAWLTKPEACIWGSQVALERASFEMNYQRDLDAAWGFLRQAERTQQRIAHRNHFFTVKQQADLLARVGAVGEGRERLRSALEDCERWTCNPRLLPDAKITLSWLTLLDPQASDSDFSHAERLLESAIDETSAAAAAPHERSNSLVNLALLQIRQGKDPAETLGRAREFLGSSEDTGRGRELSGWLQLAEATDALRHRRLSEASQICSRLATDARFPELAAWAQGCTARTRRLQGNLRGAEESFASALLLHAYSSPEELGQNIAVGPSRRGEDYYEAARVEVELQRPEDAWALLAALDNLASVDVDREGCTLPATSPRAEASNASGGQQTREDLLLELSSLETPTSASFRKQRGPAVRSLRERLQEIWRRQSECGAIPIDAVLVEPDFRAFSLVDEIILLERLEDGAIRLARRSSLTREELRQRLAKVEASLGSPEVSNEDWRTLLQPIAEALMPRDLDTLGATTSYALYGLLQGVPLTALPLQPRAGRKEAWFSELTLPVVGPPATSRPAPRDPAGAAPVFVVDPRGDLAIRDQAKFYQILFPGGIVLRGEEATHLALKGAMANSQWLHVDAHGRFDAAFPELSSLSLADRPMTFIEIADLPLPSWFANLSGCDTGTWPTTADRGRYGIGGLLTRRGVPWVIASRSVLDDRLAGDFNRALYRQIHAGAGVADAFSGALETLRGKYPAAAWGALILLGTDSIPMEGGKQTSLDTPRIVEEEDEASWKAERFAATEKRGRS